MLRSCTSIYQLLPTYPVVRVDGGSTVSAASLKGLAGLDPARASEARQFHQNIDDAIAIHQDVEPYRSQLTVWPVIGIDQPTLQSATLTAGNLTASSDLPAEVDALLRFGDGTVPLAAAVPLEKSRSFVMPFHAELHGSLQNNIRILGSLKEWLRQSQVEGLEKLKGIRVDQQLTEERPAIRLAVEDLYREGEPLVIEAQVQASEAPDRLSASVYSIGREAQPIEKAFAPSGDRWILELEGLPEGCYRIRVRCAGRSMDFPPAPVSDVFSVSRPV